MPVSAITNTPLGRLAVLLLALLHITITCALLMWSAIKQREYVHEYIRVQRLVDKDWQLPKEIQNILDWRRQTPFLDVYSAVQTDTNLERKRRRLRWYMALPPAYWLVGMTALLIFFG